YGASQQAGAAKSAAGQEQAAALAQLGLTSQEYNAGGVLSLPQRELGGLADAQLGWLTGLTPNLDVSPDFAAPQLTVNPDGTTSLNWVGPSSGYSAFQGGPGNPNAPGTIAGTQVYGPNGLPAAPYNRVAPVYGTTSSGVSQAPTLGTGSG